MMLARLQMKIKSVVPCIFVLIELRVTVAHHIAPAVFDACKCAKRCRSSELCIKNNCKSDKDDENG